MGRLVHKTGGWVGGLVHGTGGWVGGLVHGTGGWVEGLVRGTGGWVGGLVHGTGGWVGRLVHGTGGWVEGLVHGTGGWVGGLVRRTGGWVEGLVHRRVHITEYGETKLTLGNETSDSMTNLCSAWAIFWFELQGIQSNHLHGVRSSCLEFDCYCWATFMHCIPDADFAYIGYIHKCTVQPFSFIVNNKVPFQYSQKENTKRKYIRLLIVVAMSLRTGKNFRSHPMWSTGTRVHVVSCVGEVGGHRALNSGLGFFK